MRIGVIGMGVVGKATAGMWRRLGHEVTVWDKDEHVRAELSQRGWNLAKPLRGGVVFVCVPEDAVREVVEENRGLGWLVVRSTTLPGTLKRLRQDTAVHLAHNPEFLREAVAEYEAMNPNLIVIGECCKRDGDILEELYRPFQVPIVRTDPTTSEVVKLTINAYLSATISFWNELKGLCDALGVNSHLVGLTASLDPRVPSYGSHMHGAPFGGKCLPKDLNHLIEVADSLNVGTPLLDAVKKVNEAMAK